MWQAAVLLAQRLERVRCSPWTPWWFRLSRSLETSLAERTVADLLPIATTSAEAVRLCESVPLWFHTFALGHGIYTPGLARDHGYRLPVLGAERFAGAALDVGAFDGFYSFLAERRGARRVVAVDNEQYVEWVEARFGVSLTGGAGFHAIAGALESNADYRRMDGPTSGPWANASTWSCASGSCIG